MRGGHGEILWWIGTADELCDRTDAVRDEPRAELQIAQLRTMLETLQPSGHERFGFVGSDLQARRIEALLAAELPSRERAVLRLVACGYTNAETATLVGVSRPWRGRGRRSGRGCSSPPAPTSSGSPAGRG